MTEMELSVNPFLGSVAPEGHHLEPHHGRARDRLLQDQQEVNSGAGETQNSTAEPREQKRPDFFLSSKLNLPDISRRF